MILLGLDPGATTGFCLYDTETRRVIDSGHSRGTEVLAEAERAIANNDAIIIERPKGYGPTYPQVVDAAYVCGYLAGTLGERGCNVEEVTRRDVCAVLTDATHGCVRVKNDATAWAALVLLHGDGSDRRPRTRKGKVIEEGGPLGNVKSHARAALAVAVAWDLRQQAARVGA